MASHSKMSLVTLLVLAGLFAGNVSCLDARRKIHSRSLFSEDAAAGAETSGDASGSGSLSLDLGSSASSGVADTGGVETSYGDAAAGIEINEADYADVESDAYSYSGVESATDFGFAEIDASAASAGEDYAQAGTEVIVEIVSGETEDGAFGSTFAAGIAEGLAGGDGYVDTQVVGETESFLDDGDFAYGSAGIEGEAESYADGYGGNAAGSELNLGTIIEIEEYDGEIDVMASVGGGGGAAADGQETESYLEVEGGTVVYAANEYADGAISDGEGQAYGSVITSQDAYGYGPSLVQGSTEQTSVAAAATADGVGVGYSSAEGTSFGAADGEYVSSYGAVSGETDANSDAFNGAAWTEGDSEGMFVSSAYGDGYDYAAIGVGGAASSLSESAVLGAFGESVSDGGASTGANAEGDYSFAETVVNGYGTGNSGSSALESGGLAMAYGTGDAASVASGYTGESSANANGGGSGAAASGAAPDGAFNEAVGSGSGAGQADGEYTLTENTVTGYGATMSISTDVGSVGSGSSLGVTITDAEIQTAGGSKVEGYGPVAAGSGTEALAMSLAETDAGAYASDAGAESGVSSGGNSKTEGYLSTEGVGEYALVESGGVLVSEVGSETLFGAGSGAELDKYGAGLGFGSTIGSATGGGYSDLSGGAVGFGGAATFINGGSNADSSGSTTSLALAGEDSGFGATVFDAAAGGSGGGNIATYGAATATELSAGGAGVADGAAQSLSASEDAQSIGGTDAFGQGSGQIMSATAGPSTSNFGAAGGEGEVSGFSESGSEGGLAETASASEGDGDSFVAAETEGEETAALGFAESGGAVLGFGGAETESGIVAGEFGSETFIEATTSAEGEDSSIDKSLGSGAEGGIAAAVLDGDTSVSLGSDADSGGSIDAEGDVLSADPDSASDAFSFTLGEGEGGDFLYIDGDGNLGGGDTNADGVAYALAFGDALGESDPRDYSLDSEVEAGAVALAAGLSSSIGIDSYGPQAAFGAGLAYGMSFVDVEAEQELDGLGGFVNVQADAFDSATGFGLNGGDFDVQAAADAGATGQSILELGEDYEALVATGSAYGVAPVFVATEAAGEGSEVYGLGAALAEGVSANGFGPSGPSTFVDFGGDSSSILLEGR